MPPAALIRPATIFITGTDTGAGKTRIACGLLRAARAAGIAACGFKPVASGCRRTRGGLRNDDALALQAAAGTDEPYERINPYALRAVIAPHLAARAAGQVIDTQVLDLAYAELARRYALIVVEGAGGWQVPLNEDTTFADWVARRGWPVVLVVGMRLGCINHALLSADAIQRRTRLLGWIANALPPRQPVLRENVEDLRRRLPVPLLGEVSGRRVLKPELASVLAAAGAFPDRP